MLPHSTPPQQALLRSGSGSHAAAWLHTLPTCQGTRMPAELFQTALRRRLRLPLNLHHRTCGHEGRAGCRLPLDMYGDHLAACPRTGLLARRAGPIERAWTRVLREAGARVAHKQLLRDTNVRVRNPQDQRQLDMVAYGITTSGSALCCDATMVSPLQRNGHPIPRAAIEDGVALARAERRKRHRYPELATNTMGRLVVLGCEVGGRWNEAACHLVGSLAKQKARNAPVLLRLSARAAWHNRWWGLLSVACQTALASTLCGQALTLGGPTGEDDPFLGEVLEGALWSPSPSRLPLRG